MRRLALAFVVAPVAAVAGPANEPLRAHAVRATGAITIDGRLDEPAWRDAPKQSGFTQRFPQDGGKVQYDTSFAILYDDKAIYVGVWADDPEPDKIRALLTRRDVDSPSDVIAIGFDSYHDRRTAFVFQLNAAGVQRDMLLFDDQNLDDTWDAVWTGETAIGDHGWTAEFRIPLNQLRFSADDVHEWGFQISRTVARTQEQSTWSPWPRSGPQIVSRFGVVDGIEHLAQGRRLELLPYATAGVDVEPIQTGDPLNRHVSAIKNAGVDVKLGLGPAFTLSATINPDFGQVEADPSQVNLSPNELFFAEKRPFFLEGVDLFKLPIGNSDSTVESAFYSRRIGAVPALIDSSNYEFIRAPIATTIYGAAKLTGKTKSGWSVGLLEAVTGEESVPFIDNSGGRQDVLLAPLTNFAVGRVKRDFNEGETSIGASATAVDRALGGTSLLGSMHDQAYSAGLQLQHRWGDDAWQINFSSVGSWVHGTPDAMAITQQSNVHLFQRPDATDVMFDPTRTSMSGLGATWQAGRLGKTEHWRAGIGGDLRTPGLELNDLGFQTASDRLIPYLWGQYRDDEPGAQLANWQINADVFTMSNFEPTLLSYGLEYNWNALLANYWSLTAGGNIARNLWDPVALRGGPALRVDPSASFYANVTSDRREKISASFNLRDNYNWTTQAHTFGVDLGVMWQARPNLDISLGPSWTVRDDPLQYVAEADDTTGMHHFILGRIQQGVASVTTRVNWTFSPHLSLQVYAQPFAAAGRYTDYKDVDAPHAPTFAERFHVLQDNDYAIMGDTVVASYRGSYSFAKPDFDVRQLRSTIVLRWEYRPGSVVYGIWSHNQSSTLDAADFRFGPEVSALASGAAENIVMVKASYWIGL